jgi:hypothetical protein
MFRALVIIFIASVAVDYFLFGGQYMEETGRVLKVYGRDLYAYINGKLNPGM